METPIPSTIKDLPESISDVIKKVHASPEYAISYFATSLCVTITEIMKAKNITTEEVANTLGITKEEFLRILIQDTDKMTISELIQIGLALNCDTILNFRTLPF